MSKVWFITGSTRGLDRAITEATLKACHSVVATARKLEHLGVAVTHHDFAGVDHACTHQKPVATARATIDMIVSHLRAAFASGDRTGGAGKVVRLEARP